MIRCGYCYSPFKPTQAEQRYCRRNHALAARRSRARKRAAEAARAIAKGHPICPRPDKKQFSSPEQAALAWEAKQPELVAYRCRCGALHYGHRHGPYIVRSTTA